MYISIDFESKKTEFNTELNNFNIKQIQSTQFDNGINEFHKERQSKELHSLCIKTDPKEEERKPHLSMCCRVSEIARCMVPFPRKTERKARVYARESVV